MKSRLVAVILVLALMFTCVPVPGKATGEKTLDCADISGELLPEELRDRFTLLAPPEVLSEYGYYQDCSFKRVGKAILYHTRYNSNLYGLVDNSGRVLTDLVYSSPYRIYYTDMVFLPLADGSGIHVLNDSTGVITEDLLLDADGGYDTYTVSKMCKAQADGKTVILSFDGTVLQKDIPDVASCLPLTDGVMALRNTAGFYAVLNESGMTDFVYSRIGYNAKPYASNGMVYAERDGIAGFINLETLKEVAFRYDTGSIITATGKIHADYRGDYALSVWQDPETYDLWYGVLDKSGKQLYAISGETYPRIDSFYQNTSVAYYEGNASKLHLLTLSDEGLQTKELGTYLMDIWHTTASGVSYSGCSALAQYGFSEMQDGTTKECVLLNKNGEELLRGYDRLEAKVDSETNELLWIAAQNTEGKYSIYVPGSSFTEYLYDEILDYDGYVRVGITDKEGTTTYRLITPLGTELFADLEATDCAAYVNRDNHAVAWTDNGSYLCHLPSGKVSGPYDFVSYIGQNRFMTQQNPCTLIDGKGSILAEDIPGYIRFFSEGYAEYSLPDQSYYQGLIDRNGTVYDFGWSFDSVERGDDDYNYDIFYDGTAVIRPRNVNGYTSCLLIQNSDGYEDPVPQLLYSAPVSHTVGLPLFGTITLTFDRPVTLPAEEDVRLVCVSDGEELPLSVSYGNSTQTVIRLTLDGEMMSCGERYSLYIQHDAICSQSDTEQGVFPGFVEEDDFTFTISKDGVSLSDLDLIRYFPDYLRNGTTASFENAATDAYVDIINSLSLKNDLRISLFHALKDSTNAFMGYIPGVSALRHTQLLDETTYTLMKAVTDQQSSNWVAKSIAVWAEGLNWTGKMSEDDAFIEGLSVFLKPTDVDQFTDAMKNLESVAETMTFAVDMQNLLYTIVTTELMNRVVIEQLRDAIPYDCHLKQGLTNLLRSINEPDYLATKYLLDNQVLKALCDVAENLVFSEAGKLIGIKQGTDVVLNAGVVMFAKLILMGFSATNELLGGASYNDINELLLLSGFCAALNSAVVSRRAELMTLGKACTQEAADEYKMLYSAYLTCLKLTLQAAANIATPAEMGGDISMRATATTYANALEDGTYSYDVYMAHCKKNALNEASGKYLYDVIGKTHSAVLTGTPSVSVMSVRLMSDADGESELPENSGTTDAVNGEILYLPDQIDGYPVTSVGKGPWTENSEIAVLVIPDTVTEIGEGAFAGCTALKYAILGKNVKTIGQDAFSGCTELISANLPSSLETIGSGAFKDCIALHRVSVAASEILADDTAFPEGVLFCGSELSCAASLAEQFAGTGMISAALENELELLCEPYRLHYAPGEWIDGAGMLLGADGEQIESGWVICHGTDDVGETIAVVHYLGKKTTFPISVGEDELHFPTLYHLQVPTWEEGTAIAAAYDSNDRQIEVFLFQDACGTVFDLPWNIEPDHVKGFLLRAGSAPLTEHADLTSGST